MSSIVSPDLLRKALGQFPTGVTVITTLAKDGRPAGLTVNSFAPISLQPPMVLWSLQSSSPNLQAFIEAGNFAVSVLSQQQQELSRRFANRHVVDKFAGVDLLKTESGLPVLSGSVAHFECDLHSHSTVGDHELFVGRVLRFEHVNTKAPLLFWRGDYAPLEDMPQEMS